MMKSSQLFALLMSASIASYAGTSYAQLTPEEAIMRQMELTPVEGTQETGAIQTDMTEVIDTLNVPAATEELPAQTPNTAVAADSATPSINDNWTGTLMFEAQNVQALKAIYRDFLMRKEAQKPTKTGSTDVKGPGVILDLPIFGEEPKEIPEEILKFSLNSIVYENPNDWAIWVNGQFFNAQKAREGFSLGSSDLRVIDINRNQVTYLWTPIVQSFDKVQGRWEEKQRLSGLVVSTQVAQNEHVAFNEDDKTVTITMRPNQTFISQFMSVLEGVDTIRNTAKVTAADTINSAPEEQMPDEQGEATATTTTQVELPPSVQDEQPLIIPPESPSGPHRH